MLSAARQIATRRLGGSLASAEATVSRHFSARQRRSRSGTCITSFAPTRQPRSHRTSPLSSRSFRGVRFPNKGDVVCTAGFRVHPEREDVMGTMLLKCKREVHAAFDRHTHHLLAFGSCCQNDKIHGSLQCLQKTCVACLLRKQVLVSGVGSLLQTSEVFVFLYVGDAGNTSLSLPQECWLSALGVLHPGVPVMWYGHIRDLSPTAEAVRGAVCPM